MTKVEQFITRDINMQLIKLGLDARSVISVESLAHGYGYKVFYRTNDRFHFEDKEVTDDGNK